VHKGRKLTTINIKSMEEKGIVFSIVFDEEEVQSFAEANFERELTELELNRMKMHWYEDGAAYGARTELLASAIKMAINTKDYNFERTDRDYLESGGGK